ncbi:MAG: hypothetical protein ACRCT8_05930 [Lacipirellulaceae bacterium]
MQYQIDDIPEDLDRAARSFAAREGMTLNQALIRVLSSGFGVDAQPVRRRELPPIFDGTPLEPEVLEALESQRQIDPETWK